jgi:hypothetical protein
MTGVKVDVLTHASYGMADTAKASHQQQVADPTPFSHAGKANAAEAAPLGEGTTPVAEDGIAPLRSVRSILKSGDLDGEGSEKVKRVVSWHDFEGKNLHTVREYTPW